MQLFLKIQSAKCLTENLKTRGGVAGTHHKPPPFLLSGRAWSKLEVELTLSFPVCAQWGNAEDTITPKWD